MFRQYASNASRWMSPDPYIGSMDLGDPQSLNRYSYAANSPLRYTDPLGLRPCNGSPADSDGPCDLTGGGIIQDIIGLFSWFHHPKLKESHTPRLGVRQVQSTITQTGDYTFLMTTVMQNPIQPSGYTFQVGLSAGGIAAPIAISSFAGFIIDSNLNSADITAMVSEAASGRAQKWGFKLAIRIPPMSAALADPSMILMFLEGCSVEGP